MLKFQLNQPKQITIQQLTSDFLNENWRYKWYACRKNNCNKSDNTFYSVKDINKENVIDKWITVTQVEFEFFEINIPTFPTFYIFVEIDKGNDEEICYYSVEVKVIDGETPVIIFDLSKLDCLNIIGQKENVEITGKLSARFAPRLKQIKLDVPSVNSIEILDNIVNLTKINETNDFTNYEFKFNINILTFGVGRINISYITYSNSLSDVQNTYKFFIFPDLQQHLNPTTTLPWSCSNTGRQSNSEVLTFVNNHTITTTLDLKLFDGFLDKFVFIYSIAEVIMPNFCDDNNLDSISSYREVARINGNQTNGISHTFITDLTPQHLNNLPRPFTYTVRLEAKRIDIDCSNIVNLRGWTVL